MNECVSLFDQWQFFKFVQFVTIPIAVGIALNKTFDQKLDEVGHGFCDHFKFDRVMPELHYALMPTSSINTVVVSVSGFADDEKRRRPAELMAIRIEDAFSTHFQIHA